MKPIRTPTFAYFVAFTLGVFGLMGSVHPSLFSSDFLRVVGFGLHTISILFFAMALQNLCYGFWCLVTGTRPFAPDTPPQ